MIAPRAIAIVPARYDSKRFPGKPLASIGGLPMVVRVFNAAREAKRVVYAAVATDSEEVKREAEKHGAPVILTTAPCASGTARVAEAVRGLLGSRDVVVNVQGDEPLIRPESIDALIEEVEGTAEIATLATSRHDKSSFRDPNCVKIVADDRGDALYFSRAGIPFGGENDFLLHVGVYAFRRSVLEYVCRPGTKISRLEARENLEQIRWMEMGYRIRVVRAAYPLVAVDTPADLARARLFVRE